MLAARGAVVVDADQLAREVVEPGGVAYPAVVDRFGPGIVGPNGALDRQALAAVVFADPGARSDLEGIIWPAVGQAMRARLAEEAPTDHVVVLDIPLLAESASGPRSGDKPSGEGPSGDGPSRDGPSGEAPSGKGRPDVRPDLGLGGVIVVDCPVEVAVARLVAERGMDEADVRSRMAAQASRQARLALADVVIDNAGDRAQLEAEVSRAWAWIEARAGSAAGGG
ncbi:MAG: dephospho-CoA kinase [Acidimicrobiales bacterium]|nr:dephospho-CoA kinase [Acidimicrobiales bacterium]